MKVTKRRSGYTIRLNHNEFAMLEKLVELTPEDVRKRALAGNVKAAYTRRSNATKGDIFHVDKDISDQPRPAPKRPTNEPLY